MSYSSCCFLRNRPAESSHSATPMMRTLDWGRATQAGRTTLRKRRASTSSLVRSRGFPRSFNRTNRSVVRAESNGERQSRGPAQATQDDGWRRTSGYDYPPRTNTIGSTQDWNGPPPRGPPGGGPEYGQGGGRNFTPALLAAAFVVGLGTGVWFDSEVNLEPQNVASTEILDRRTPSSEVCMANGYSAMVFDQRIFVSFNPFNVYVTQPEVKPGCVLRRSNYNVLENRKLISSREVDSCKRGMNTFAFVGDLEQRPEISCVYHSEEAENQYLINPKRAVMGDGYQAREIQE